MMVQPLRNCAAPRGRVQRSAALAAVAVVMATGLAACGGSPSSAAQSGQSASSASSGGITAPAEISKAGVFTLCADLVYPPMTFTKNNAAAGFDVDLANALASKMGVHAQFEQTGFPNIIGALEGGKCDGIMNGMNGTPARGKQIGMVPYLEDGHGFAVPKGNPKHITTVDDLAGKNVATQLGSSDQQYLEDLNKQLAASGKPKINIVTFSQDPAAFAALSTGKVDAFFQDLVVLGYYAKSFANSIDVAHVSVNQQTIVIGLRKSDTALKTALTQGVKELYADGTVKKLAAKWGIGDLNLLKQS